MTKPKSLRDKETADLEEPPPEYWEQEQSPEIPPDVEHAMLIRNWLASHDLTQAKLADLLRDHDNVTAIVADMLGPQGYDGWKLELKRSRRGTPGDYELALYIEHLYDREVAYKGKRGAIKRVAQELKMSSVAVRSAMRRAAGTHDSHRKKSGRK